MRMRRYALTFFAAAVLQGTAMAQFDFGNDDPPTLPWEQFKLNPKARLKLDFRNANVDAILQTLSQASGIAIVKDPALIGGLTVQSPKPQSLPDAFAQLNAVLGLKNYEIKKDGNFLVVRPKQARGGGRFNGFGGGGGAFGGAGGGASSSPQLKVYPIRYANATQVARVINESFANSGVPPQDPQNNVPAPGGGFPGGVPGFGGGGGRGQGGGNFGRRGGGAANNTSLVRASADDYSNSVIVNAPSREQDQVSRLITQIDKQTDQPQQSRVYPLQYASASDIAPVIQNVLTSNAPRGRGGAGVQSVPIDQRFQAAARFGNAQAAFGNVVAEARTNSVVVTATADNLGIVEKLVKELDKPVAFESSSFVITLANARADQIANLLNQSFGGRTTTSTLGTTAGGAPRTTTVNRQNTNNSGPAQLGGRSVPLSSGATRAVEDPQAVGIDLSDPNADSGELATRVSVQQGGGFRQFFGGGNQTRQQTGGATGLDAQGRVTNVRDLTGQVVAIPDINTNSVIIVTSPENREIIRQILDRLDRIPEQVVIETMIVEASLDATNKLGVEWNLHQGKVFGDPANNASTTSAFGLQPNIAQPQGFRYTLNGTGYSLFLQALQSDSRFEVLSTPRIFTSNNATASINISQSLPYVLSQREDGNGNLTFNYAFLDVGIILTVTPRITSNGYVTMDVTQTANDFVRYTDFNAPVVNQREAQTTISVKDGETAVLGGIIRNTVATTVNKVPLLGDIPILGNLFRSNNTEKVKTELLVFLTPRVVRSDDESRRLREITEKTLDPKTQDRLTKEREIQTRAAAAVPLPPPPAPIPAPAVPTPAPAVLAPPAPNAPPVTKP